MAEKFSPLLYAATQYSLRRLRRRPPTPRDAPAVADRPPGGGAGEAHGVVGDRVDLGPRLAAVAREDRPRAADGDEALAARAGDVREPRPEAARRLDADAEPGHPAVGRDERAAPAAGGARVVAAHRDAVLRVAERDREQPRRRRLRRDRGDVVRDPGAPAV